MGASEERERYEELLQEMRVMLPGVEVLFAFLLTSVFAQRFQELDSLGRTLFVVALVTSALTVLLLLVPAALHRMADIDRERRVRLGSRFQVIGSLTLGLSMVIAMFVIVRMIYDTTVASSVAGGVALAWVALWYGVPRMVSRS